MVKKILSLALLAITLQVVGFGINRASAQGGFAVQVTPSPLIDSVKPGESKTLELNVLNTSGESQAYEVDIKSFAIDSDSGQIDIGDDAPSDVKQFVRFDQNKFSLKADEFKTLKMRVDVPADAGFSYSFAVMLSKVEAAADDLSTTKIKGSVAVFTLLTVDRPGAVRSFEVSKFTSQKKSYEYLPAKFSLKFKNTGNTPVQPKGNIFISRKADDEKPISVLDLNETDGYILPGTERTLDVKWLNGFPVTKDEGGLRWDWSKLSELRIGKYTAKMVAIYDDGERDVPVESSLTFWVMPWKFILGLLLALALIVVGIASSFSKTLKMIIRKPKG